MNALLFVLLAVLFAVVIYGIIRMLQSMQPAPAPAKAIQPCGCGGCGRCPCCNYK